MKTILMTVYDINPYKGSESGTGWNFVIQAARFNKTVAITRKNNRQNIEKYIEEFNVDTSNIEFSYFDLPYYLRFWKKGARGSSLYFYLWQMFMPVFVKMNDLTFDIVHNVNFHADAFPTFLWLLDKPLVWGPINHNEKIPKEYIVSGSAYLKDRFKWFLKILNWNLDPFMILAKKKARFIIGGNSSVKKRLKIKDQKFIHMTQVASIKSEKNIKMNNTNFNVLIVGRFLTIKAFDLALYSFENFFNSLLIQDKKKVKLTIIGTGPLDLSLREIVEKFNSKKMIEFIGWVDKGEMDSYYKEASVFVFPSHEGAGMVVVEALSHGLPVICFDNYGAGEFVDENCAIKLPYTNYKQSIIDFKNAIEKLFMNKELYNEMCISAKSIFEEKYTWNVKGAELKDIYKQVLDSGSKNDHHK